MVKQAKGASFEDNLKKLENVVEKLESEDTPIEKSLEFFEEGVKISKELSGKLDEVKRKIEILKKDASGIKLEEYEEE
ncbi:MAG: exodeoxyribonuclease VII small subunit [Elusimicrobia bacterium]|nr:exodeoxyribonuclease VII small subunit [Elusimicrobiota bacterium]